METFKKGDYIAIRTNQPAVGFIERFGYGLSTDNIEPDDYIAHVKDVIDCDNYFVYIPSVGYRCIIDRSEIVGKVSENELSDEDRDEEICFHEHFSTPSYVYTNESDVPGSNIKEKCEYLTKKAMSELFPEDKIVGVELEKSDYLKAELIKGVDEQISRTKFKDQQFLATVQKKKDYFVEMLNHLRFKEYYSIRLGVQGKFDENATDFHLVVIDTKFEEVIIAKGIDERTKFFHSLGPEYDSVSNFHRDLKMEIMLQEEVVKLKLE